MKRTWSQTQEYGQLGIIESVCLRNFMCHDNLSFDFDPHMNFIIGRNGSGKSAVLTGIILALGGKSGATGRHSNIKGFIKNGKNNASVSVTLKNCGPEAYKPNDYGNKITVERHFNLEGHSQYKIKSQAGHILSNSKEELTNILSVMDIQIENPITVLTQEISRNFLVSKTSKGHKLFQLFYSGTGLSKLEEDYNRAVQSKEEAEAELKHKKSVLPEMLKELKHLKILIDKSSKVTELKTELLWANVISFERDRDEGEVALAKVKHEISVLNEKIDNCKTEHSKVSQDLTEAQAGKTASNDKMNSLRKSLHELTTKRSLLTAKVREFRGTYARYEREVKKLSSEASSLENMINEIKLKNQSSVDEDNLKRDAKINELKQQASQVDNEINSLDKKKDHYFEAIADMMRNMDTCQAEIQDLRSSLQNVEREKQNLVAGMANRIEVYGPEMKPLLQDINNAVQRGMFRKEPKGPVGLYINVKNPEWNFAVQECLKIGTFKTFCCDNHTDADQLMKIINKHYSSSRSKPSVITSKFVSQMFDVGQFKTDVGHPTILDMLDISDPVIANCLIDQRQIENILLIADPTVASDLMLDNPPKNCLSAYTLKGDQICHSPYRYYSCRKTNQICILKTVNQEDISKKEDELKLLNAELGKKTASKRKLQQELGQNEKEKKQLDSDLTNLKIKLKQIQMKIKDEENSFEEPKDINCLQSDLEGLLKEKNDQEEKLLSCKEEISCKEEELGVAESSITEYRDLLQVESESFQSLTASIDESESKKENLNSAIKKYQAQLKALEPSLKECETKLKNLVSVCEIATNTAEGVGPRIETRRSPDNIRRLLEDTKKTVHKQRNCDPETLLAEYEEKTQRYNNAVAELDRQAVVHNRIGEMMTKRFQEFQKICNNTIVSLTCCFTILLKENNFTGFPKVNLETQTLEIYAKPDKMNSKEAGSNQNLAQLSGGERSYVTIAFLLALWDRIHMPFRILDEYDVFMDSNNRHLSINLLINAARSNKNVQYVFLSPLELPPMADSSHVKVHKMPEPKR